ncbi:MAG: EpsI family protein, partial [Deltaproteobacteria bacterium]|nr:EpsI family protein [Deltaproteobacteria bacterium]
ALLIPAVSAYLIWERRSELKEAPVRPSLLGGGIFFILLVISTYGILGSSPSAVRPAVPLVILSLVLFCYGRRILKITAFPLSMLIFMIPLPTLFGSVVGYRLKLLSTRLGESILRLFDIPVFVEGNVIDLGVLKLQVVDACSGLRYILPLLAIGLLFSYFFERSPLRRGLIVISTIPLAVFTNGVRIGFTGILAQCYGLEAASGFFHSFSGWLVFMFALGLMFLLHITLKIIPPQSKTKPRVEKHCDVLPVTHRSNILPVTLSSLLLLAVGILNFLTTALPAIQIRGGLAGFPLKLEDWQGRRISISPEIIEASGAEDAFEASYYRPGAGTVSLYLGYRGSPFGENTNFFHSPDVCLPSSGWKTLHSSAHEIRSIPHFGKITVKRLMVEKAGQRHLVYYWFQTRDKTSFDVNINRFHLALHAILRDNTHDLFIRLITGIHRNEGEKKAEVRLDDFTRVFMGVLLDFLAERQTIRDSAGFSHIKEAR